MSDAFMVLTALGVFGLAMIAYALITDKKRKPSRR